MSLFTAVLSRLFPAPMEDPYGTVRRAPEGFAHAIRLEQPAGKSDWEVIDLWGPMGPETFDGVADWPVVYRPIPDDQWERACLTTIGSPGT